MPIVPTGDPAWIRTADHTTYGGDTEKTNFQSQGVTNARTDVGAEAFTRMAADLAAVQRTAPFCTVTFLCNDGVPAAPTITFVNQMTGIRSVQYAGDSAPSGFPSGARNGNGDVTFTWSTTYDDPYGIAGAINIVHAEVSGIGSTAIIATYEITSANVVRVRLFDAAGVAISDKRASLSIWTGQ
jgi:hypothetical protein